MSEQKPKAVILLSGGLDSATIMAIAKSSGFDCYPLTFDYGQRHRIELEAAVEVAAHLQVNEVKQISLDLRAFGGSALTDDIDVPKDRPDLNDENDIPVTYVPARNTILLSFGLGYAEVIGATAIFIGANAVDYSGYPDCRPEFISAFERLANLATAAGVSGNKLVIHAPLIDLTKAEIIEKGTALGVDYGLTHSCYDPVDGKACGACDSCLLRRKGFQEAGVPDPTYYVDG